MKTMLTVALLLLAVVCSAQQAPPAALQIADVDEYLSRAEAFGFSGGIVVMEGGKVVLERGYGLADRARKQRITPATLFDIGSITKTYTAMAIHQMIDRGKLSLDDPLVKFFPNAPEDKKAITVRQLMNHTAGLPLYSGEDYELVSREEMVRRTLAEKLPFAPGSRWAYCNTCYQLLTVMVEDLSGQPYEQYIHEQLLKPAGITRTGYVIPNFLDQPVASGYQGETDDGTPLQKAWYGDGPSWNLRGAGGFLAPLRDVALWARALDGTAIASAAAKKRAWEPAQKTNREGEHVGHGWYVRDTAWGGRQVGHSGGNGFFAMNLRRFLDRDVIFVFATNHSGADWVNEGEAASRLFGAGKKPMPPRATTNMPAEALARVAGRYRLASGQTFDITFANGQPLLDPLATPELLAALARPKDVLTTDEARALGVKGARVFTAIAAGDYEPLLASLPPDVSKEGEREFWSGWRERAQKNFGKFLGAETLWVAAAEDQTRAAVLLRFERANRLMQFQQRKDGQFAEVRSPVVLPQRFVFVPGAPGELVTWNQFSGETIAMRIEKDAIIIGGVRAARQPS